MTVDIPRGKRYPVAMAKGSDSKEKTLAAAARLFCRRGYHGTALQDVLAASGAPRGSLYFHFPGGKEEIAEVLSRRRNPQETSATLVELAHEAEGQDSATVIIAQYSIPAF